MTSPETSSSDEIIESVTVSPVGKFLIAAVIGAALGIVIGLGVSALLAEEKSPAPRVPSFAKGEPEGPSFIGEDDELPADADLTEEL